MTAPGGVVPVPSHLPEALRLALAFERESRGLPEGPWLSPAILDMIEALRKGEVTHGFLLVGPSDEAVGLSVTGPPSETGTTVHPYLADGFRTPATLATFLDAIDRLQPVRVVYEPIIGVPATSVDPVLTARGFRRIVRADMTIADAVPLPVVPEDPEFPARRLTPEDGPALARLLARAYRDNAADRALFQRWLDPDEDAQRSVAEMLGRGLGTWRSDASFGVPVPGGLASATLVHDFHGPLVSEVMTDPAWRRRGFARRLLIESVRAVRSAGLGAPRLVVTLGNDRAHALYRSLGFVENPEAQGGVWIRPSAVPVGPVTPR